MYLLINTNFLIPEIKEYDSLEKSIEQLQYDSISRSLNWVEKVYVVKKNEQDYLYKSDGKQIYYINLLTNQSKIFFTYKKYNYSGVEYWIKYNSISSENFETTNMNLQINEKKNLNVLFLDTNTNTDTDNFIKNQLNQNISIENKNNMNVDYNILEKKNLETNIETENKNTNEEIIKMIEEVNELYQQEIFKIKKLEQNLKIYDNKLKKLEKDKKDNIINNIIRTQGEYRTWKKIKYGLIENSDFSDFSDFSDILKPISELIESNMPVPILFLSKYDYIEKIQTNEYIRILLDKINLINLNDLYSVNFLPEDEIVQFCNKYMKLSNELHYHFDDHEWNYLVNEININSTNKLGSNIVSSKKI